MTADVGKALRTKLLANAALLALVGQRFYPDNLPQTLPTLPAIVYYKVSTAREHAINDILRLAHSRIQIDCYGASRDQANNVAHAIRRSGITSYAGTTSGIVFQGAEIDSGETYQQESPTDGNQVHRYITTFDLMIHYVEEA